jgi:hypothetical protein
MQQRVITCVQCGTEKAEPDSTCSLCGSLNPSITIGLTGLELSSNIGNLGPVTEERNASGEQFRIRTQTPEGARSDELLANDIVSVKIKGPTQTGRKGEPRTINTLLNRLQQEGYQPIFEAGRDQHGEDGVLIIQNERLTLQIVTAPSIPKLWHDANLDSATKSMSVEGAAKCIQETICKKFNKTSQDELAKTFLVLDAGLVGILSAHEVVNAYLALYGDPYLGFGFANIWLVGPTPSTTTQLGTGRLEIRTTDYLHKFHRTSFKWTRALV